MKVYHLIYRELHEKEQLKSWSPVAIVEDTDKDYPKIELIMIAEAMKLEKEGYKIHMNHIDGVYHDKILMNCMAIKDNHHFVINRDLIVS